MTLLIDKSSGSHLDNSLASLGWVLRVEDLIKLL